jgi:hypothetical protein
LPEATLYSISLKIDQIGTIYLDKEFHSEENLKKFFPVELASLVSDMTHFLNDKFIEIEKGIFDLSLKK